MLGEPINVLMQTANERCKRVHPNSKVINFRMVQKGKLLGSEYDVHKYECENVESKNQVQVLSMIDQAKLTCNSLGFEDFINDIFTRGTYNTNINFYIMIAINSFKLLIY